MELNKLLNNVLDGDINMNALRFDILNTLDGYFMMGIPGAKQDYDRAETATDEEILELADEYDFDLSLYKMPKREDLWIAENKRIKL